MASTMLPARRAKSNLRIKIFTQGETCAAVALQGKYWLLQAAAGLQMKLVVLAVFDTAVNTNIEIGETHKSICS